MSKSYASRAHMIGNPHAGRPAESYRGARRNTYFALRKANDKIREPSVTFREYCHMLYKNGEWSIAPLMNMVNLSGYIMKRAPHPRSPAARHMRRNTNSLGVGGLY